MATLALSVAGQIAGGLLGGPIGAAVGRALGALAGATIDAHLFAPEQTVSEGADTRLQGSVEGAAIPRVYGWSRVTGNVIWATELERVQQESSGGKGVAESVSEEIVANFAIGLCEGEVGHFGRIWADGQLLETEGFSIRSYKGDETQLPDSLIAAKQGVGGAPAYRGLAYLVFERLPLGEFGNRIPTISVEVCRVAGRLENQIKAVTVIPGATEFGYDPEPRVRIVSPGVTAAENAHLSANRSDWSVSIDQLQDLCPNLTHVSLVVAWFGDDLRCGQCKIEPRVEAANRTIKGTSWAVAGLGRSSAKVVSTSGPGPAYGGTPSDAAVLAAIADLRTRGLQVTLYPILLMDVPDGNGLSDPYGGTEQASYPWRGRITSDPAPGLSGTPDGSTAVDGQIAPFAGTAAAGHFSDLGGTVGYAGPVEWSYRRFVLHYAQLAKMAGAEGFIIGSEMRGMSFLRRSGTEFPFVETLEDVAVEARSILGGAVKITYAADWSEYSGYQPPDSPGDKLFHLDRLWARPEVDAVGIDNYMPLADWRDGETHADAVSALNDYDHDYLQANIAGGEGYDWYYASLADREAQARTPISDGAYGEPWVWRYKDLLGWWSNAHHDRIGAVRSATPTGWVPQSKPIWFTELGCGAVDKGANLPSAFPDPKSAEDTLPYFSSGEPDPLIQRRFLSAHSDWWSPEADGFDDARNPVSPVYSGRMVDPERIYLWAWDARPFPAFPGRSDIWSDAGNYQTGHWLTGRLGLSGAGEMAVAIAADYGVPIEAVHETGPVIDGLQVDRVADLRDVLEPVLGATGHLLRSRPEGMQLVLPDPASLREIAVSELAADGDFLTGRRRADPAETVERLTFGYRSRLRDYLSASATALAVSGAGTVSRASGLVLQPHSARTAAEGLLARERLAGDEVSLALPGAIADLEPGDLINPEGQADGPFVVSEIRDGPVRRIRAHGLAGGEVSSAAADTLIISPGDALPAASPVLAGAHLSRDPAGADVRTRLVLGAFANPWPGDVVIETVAGGVMVARLTSPATMGELATNIPPGSGELWDRRSRPEVQLFGGSLSSISPESALGGGNRLLVQCDDGSWEQIGFERAELIGPDRYLLDFLLRNQDGSGATGVGASSGNWVMRFDDRVVSVPLNSELAGTNIQLTGYAGRHDATGTGFTVQTGIGEALALAPAQLRASRSASTQDVHFDWVRRIRIEGNYWAIGEVPLDEAPEAYRVTVFNGVTPVRQIETGTNSAEYLAADQTADFGGIPGMFTFEVVQLSSKSGPGHIITGVFNG